MKILGFHVVRELPKAEVREVERPVPGPAAYAKVYEVEVLPPAYSLSPFGTIGVTKKPEYAYYKTCVAANKAHPGKSVRQVDAICAGGHYWLVRGPKISISKG